MAPDKSTIAKKLEVVAAIIRYEGKILIAQRKSDSTLAPDKWEFPGGKVEPGERPMSALVREIKEELNLDIRVIRPFMKVTHDYDSPKGTIRVNLDSYDCESETDFFIKREVQDAEFIEPGRLDRFEFAPADVPIVEILILEHTLGEN